MTYTTPTEDIIKNYLVKEWEYEAAVDRFTLRFMEGAIDGTQYEFEVARVKARMLTQVERKELIDARIQYEDLISSRSATVYRGD
jgi:hypothetical protein